MSGLSNNTFTDAAGSVSDLFAGFGASAQANLKAESLDIQAQGDLAEASNYGIAATLAGQNAQFTEASTAIKEAQINRATTMAVGGQAADVAGGGFAASGSALDLMASSASQGALTKAVAGQQGLITEAGYKEQQQSYLTMQNAATTTATSLENLANETKSAGTMSEIGDFAGALIKGGAAIASLFTGGIDLTGAATGFAAEAPNNPNNPLVINRYGTPGPNVPNNPLPAIY
jgi:hypothetical protein